MNHTITRRTLLQHAGAGLATAGGLGLTRIAMAAEESKPPIAPPHTLTVIAGKPRDRGRTYGRRSRQPIHDFLDREIYRTFAPDAATKDRILRYAGACTDEVKRYSPEIMEELEGAAEGADLRVEELVLMTLHEELYHRGDIPKIEHCTAVAVGPPDTADGDTYVGQTWDWMPSVFGLSELVLWKRQNGPDLLGYAYPGLWAGAGMNAAGVALTWTSAGDRHGIKGPRVGIPSYLLIAQMLYQPGLDEAIAEARRARHAGWFTFVLGNGHGRLVNVEGSPEELAVETHRGTLARVDYGSRRMTRTPEGEPVSYSDRCRKMYDLLAGRKGQLGPADLKRFFLAPDLGIYNSQMTVDAFIFNTTRRTLEITRGLGSAGEWKHHELPRA